MTGELLKHILLSQDFEKYIVTLQAQNTDILGINLRHSLHY